MKKKNGIAALIVLVLMLGGWRMLMKKNTPVLWMAATGHGFLNLRKWGLS